MSRTCAATDALTALPLFARHFRDLGLRGDGIVSVAPSWPAAHGGPA